MNLTNRLGCKGPCSVVLFGNSGNSGVMRNHSGIFIEMISCNFERTRRQGLRSVPVVCNFPQFEYGCCLYVLIADSSCDFLFFPFKENATQSITAVVIFTLKKSDRRMQPEINFILFFIIIIFFFVEKGVLLGPPLFVA